MEVNIERECSALGGLFQQIISDMKTLPEIEGFACTIIYQVEATKNFLKCIVKESSAAEDRCRQCHLAAEIIRSLQNGTPLWEDLIAKATKLHTCLRATVQAIAAYLDSFQKIADSATNARGATKEIGTALTRICLRHKAIEGRLKTFTSAIMDCLILPLQEKLEDWKKIVINLDKEHAKEYKRARTELKKRSTDTLRLQKKARKGKCGELQRRVESSLQDVSERRQFLEETEKKAVRAALVEERSRFCLFVGFCKPVMNEELAILSELTHIQEAAEQLEKMSADPHVLPPSSEQVIQDLKGSESFWSFQTPPSSPSSLGSRKSSMCSISSLNSSSSGSSKSHQSLNHYWQRSASQNGHFPVRLSSVSSQDSGFRSQDALFLKYAPGLQVSNMSEQSDNDNSSTPPTPHVGTDSVPATTATWPNLQETLQFERAASAILKDRPHTISSEASHSQPASPVSASVPASNAGSSASPPVLSNSSTPHVSPQAIYSRPPIPQRCSSLERPSVPAKASIPNGQIIKTEPTKTVLSKVQARLSAETIQPPMYVNMSELASMAACKAQEMAMNLPPPPPELIEHTERTESTEKDGSTSESSLESSSGYGSQTTFPSEEPHIEGDSSTDLCNFDCRGSYCTLPRPPSCAQIVKQPRPASSGYGPGNLRGSLLRKSSMPGQKPPPPIRRTASISSAARQPFVPNVEFSGSLENLPPPPSFLLEAGSGSQESTNSVAKDAQSSAFPGVQMRSSPPPSQMSNSSVMTLRVAETVRTLTELKHTPASPNTVRRAHTITRSQSAERRESVGSGLIAALSAKLTPNLSPRHSRRHSEDMIARNLNQGNRSPVMGRLLQKGIAAGPGQNFLESLNAKLALQQQQVQQNQMNPVHNAARVRQLFAGRTVADPAVCHDSLMDQIKRGTSLKKTRAINDRSAPKIH